MKNKLPENVLNVVFRRGEDGQMVAECLEIPGCMSQGKDEEEAARNVLDAIKACMGVMLEDFLKKSRPTIPNLVGIQKQEAFRVAPPELQPIEA